MHTILPEVLARFILIRFDAFDAEKIGIQPRVRRTRLP
jgi:hypothetical protein